MYQRAYAHRHFARDSANRWRFLVQLTQDAFDDLMSDIAELIEGRDVSAIAKSPLYGKMAKVLASYDNELGFSKRLVDLAAFIGAKS